MGKIQIDYPFGALTSLQEVKMAGKIFEVMALGKASYVHEISHDSIFKNDLYGPEVPLSDSNIPLNRHNDHFLFSDVKAAEEYLKFCKFNEDMEASIQRHWKECDDMEKDLFGEYDD